MATDVKTLVRETEVWSLADWVKNLNASVCRPSKLPLIDRRWMPVLELVPSELPQIRWHGLECSEFRVFFFLDIRPLPFHTIIFAVIRKATIHQHPSSINQGKF